MLRADAAGIDIGAEEIFVAVPADRDSQPGLSKRVAVDVGSIPPGVNRSRMGTFTLRKY
jgi:hypothetical protein